ncbi:putative NAD/FAD-dependent oxidoreductase [Novosphingobium capsulatum]|uniref:NAD/FAD-dependent oxidoreductase n=1 Tax=Novosphingobium capsulatum TaxID=13688 RepID=A0ABU1MQV3_9SPHN|nr:FAD-dependent oxidoreductase [Novosphingobium capsulatum]MDR6512735.1 putative NAD/FAD-dependent oxidoreductase [Novosphingobium capsulatum]
MHFGIIGAGLAGLTCADRLVGAGHVVSAFDKGRGPGGRMSTRRIDTPLGQARFDHGAQFCAATTPGFARQVAEWAERGVAAHWPDAGPDAYVGVPGMNALVADLAQRHDVTFECLVKGLVHDGRHWWLVLEGERRGPFDAVVVATPAEQAAPLLSLHAFPMARAAAGSASQACWTAMMAWAEPLPLDWTVWRGDGPLAWVARNSAKPGRPGPAQGAPDCWVIQASADWSRQHLEQTPEEVIGQIAAAFADLAGMALPDPLVARAHRWRFARPVGAGSTALWDDMLRLGACGDWLTEPTVQGAWLSGDALAGRILARKAA